MTDHDLDQMARALGLDGRLDAARHFCASLVSDMEELNRANKNLVAARDEARNVAKWLIYDSGSFEGDPYALLIKYPWLKEKE